MIGHKVSYRAMNMTEHRFYLLLGLSKVGGATLLVGTNSALKNGLKLEKATTSSVKTPLELSVYCQLWQKSNGFGPWCDAGEVHCFITAQIIDTVCH